MATTIVLLSQLGGIVCVDGRADELIVTCKAMGSEYPSYAVNITDGTAILSDNDAGTGEGVTGLVLPKYDSDCDTVFPAGELIEVVITKQGRRYNVSIVDPGGDLIPGDGGVIGTTAGKFDMTVVTIEDYKMVTLPKTYLNANNDTVIEIIWQG